MAAHWAVNTGCSSRGLGWNPQRTSVLGSTTLSLSSRDTRLTDMHVCKTHIWESFFSFYKTGFHYVALAVLELTMRLASNSQKPTCFSLPSTGIKGICHYCLAIYLLKNNYFCYVSTITLNILPSSWNGGRKGTKIKKMWAMWPTVGWVGGHGPLARLQSLWASSCRGGLAQQAELSRGPRRTGPCKPGPAPPLHPTYATHVWCQLPKGNRKSSGQKKN